ncbi:olfactomedin-4 [Kryptolebias marmoratus]|uniref:Olfactomedin-4-like n=1 Tax=Kryptolebias marmoratus TaxID=37003 RepID=A0A3Q3B9Z0_KRYMA|nr:olfactomedin-4 [Kryptolebias marmoratus]
MKPFAFIQLCSLFTLTQQVPTREKCTCELSLGEKEFPHGKFKFVENNVTTCNRQITPQKTLELESLLLGLERRVAQLNKDVSILEKEDDGQLYGVLSLYIIENEMIEVRQLMDKLNSTTVGQQLLTANTTHQLQDLKAEMSELETFDTMQVVKGRQENRRLKANLEACNTAVQATVPPAQPPHGTCQRGPLQNISEVRFFDEGTSVNRYLYGSWGRDPKPQPGNESWYWKVALTTGDQYGNHIRLYSNRAAVLIKGDHPQGKVEIHSSNPTTNTIQGPNAVLYGGALFYNCYNKDAVCRFNLTAKSITTLQLPQGTRYNSNANFCHLGQCYKYTDLDLATDESGVWVVYTTNQDFGNLVLSKVEEGEVLTLGQTWRTSVFKSSVTNTFVACGVLYATRFVNSTVEEIFYSFDTTTKNENFHVGIYINKMKTNIYSLNYSPVDKMLHAYSDGFIVSYEVSFE